MIEFDEFVNESISVKAEFLDGELRHRGKETGARHIRMFLEPGLEPAGNAAGLRHSADPGRMLHHARALGQRELAEQEKSLARRGSDPVGIAAAGIQEGGLGRLGRCFCEIDQLVLDLERTQSLELPSASECRP